MTIFQTIWNFKVFFKYMKNLQAAAGDMIVTAEVLAIEANTVGTTIRIMTGDTGVNTNADMSILPIEGHTHQNTGEEITIMTTNQDQDHQHTLDIKSIRKTAQTVEGETETRLDDHAMTDEGITHLMTTKDMKAAKARIAIERLPMKKHHQEIEVLIIRATNLIETRSEMITVSGMKMVIL